MKVHKIIFVILSLALNAVTVHSQQSDTVLMDSGHLIRPGARLKQVSKQFSFTEGPAVDKAGNIFFTDQPNDKIWKYDINGRLSVFMDKTGRSNGLYFSRDGNLLACADEQNQLWSITPKKKISVLMNDMDGKRLNGPNDLWADQYGGIFFTDPYYQRDYWKRTQSELDGEKLYYLAKGSKTPVIADDQLKQPNGIVGTSDGRYLFVADIGAGKTYRYHISHGKLSGKELFVPQGSDGMTLDNKGNLYITGKGVTIYNNKGRRIGYIPVPAEWVGNICFGGKKRTLLFITASESIYTLEMGVKGVE